MPVYREFFEAQFGIAIRAADAVKRVCNIPLKISPADLIDIIIDARNRMPQGASTYAMYSNVDITSIIDKAARDKANVVYNTADPWGKPTTHIRDVRCRRMDFITNNEEQVA
jgi:hypothetical protein